MSPEGEHLRGRTSPTSPVPYGLPALPGHPQLVEASLLLCPSVCLSFCDEDPISLTRDPPHDSLASVN